MSPRALRICSKVGFSTGVLGVLSVIPMLSWPEQSAPGLVKYPFTTQTFYAFQSWFFVHHIGLVIMAVGLASSGAVGTSRIGRASAWLAVLGLAGLTGMELFAMKFSEWDNKVASTGIMGTGYGMTTSLVGLGMLIAGIYVLRARVWSGWWRFIPLLLGITHFMVVTPAVFSNGWLIARLAIASWMALFGALGYGMGREFARA